MRNTNLYRNREGDFIHRHSLVTTKRIRMTTVRFYRYIYHSNGRKYWARTEQQQQQQQQNEPIPNQLTVKPYSCITKIENWLRFGCKRTENSPVLLLLHRVYQKKGKKRKKRRETTKIVRYPSKKKKNWLSLEFSLDLDRKEANENNNKKQTLPLPLPPTTTTTTTAKNEKGNRKHR